MLTKLAAAVNRCAANSACAVVRLPPI